MPPRRRPDPEPTLSIFPDQVHIGDRFMDADIGDEDKEWEVASRPVTFKKGHEVRARVQRPGDPGTAREKYWAAHMKIMVRRGTVPAPTRSTAKPDDDADDVENQLHKEVCAGTFYTPRGPADHRDRLVSVLSGPHLEVACPLDALRPTP